MVDRCTFSSNVVKKVSKVTFFTKLAQTMNEDNVQILSSQSLNEHLIFYRILKLALFNLNEFKKICNFGQKHMNAKRYINWTLAVAQFEIK